MEASHQPLLNGVAVGSENNGDRLSYRLGQLGARFTTSCGDHGHLPASQISYQRGVSIRFTLRPMVFDHHILALGESGILETLRKCSYPRPRNLVRRKQVNETDHRHRRLLRTHSERRCCHHTAEKCDELAPTCTEQTIPRRCAV